MGKPFAAALPIARRIGTLHHVRNGIERKAPPAARRLDAIPIADPAAKSPGSPGSWRDVLGLRSKKIWVAAKNTRPVKMIASGRVGMKPATSAAAKDPVR